MHRFRDFLTVPGSPKEGQPLPFLFSDSLSLLGDVQGKEGLKVVVSIDATYSGYLLNHRVYPGKYMGDRRSWGTWISKDRGGVAPYDKPILTHHQQDRGDPIGRVVTARWIQLWNDAGRFKDDWRQPATRYEEGSGKIIIDAAILDPEAQVKVLDGRYSTFSSGQSSSNAWCSVCGHDVAADGWCEHVPGRVYEIEAEDESVQQVSMYLITGYLDYHEGSFVNIPGNAFSKVTEIKVDDLERVAKQVEDGLRVEHANSYGVAALPAWSRVALVDAAGATTELVRPEGAEDKIPYGRGNVRGPTSVAVIDDIETPASVETDQAEPEGTMEYDAFALANVARSIFHAGPIEAPRGARSSDRVMYGAHTSFRTITDEQDGHRHILDLEVNLRTGEVRGYTSMTSDETSEHSHIVEMTVEDLNALRKGVKGKTGPSLHGREDDHAHGFSLGFGASDSGEFMSLEDMLDRIQALETCIETNELTDRQVRQLRPVEDDLEILEKQGRDTRVTAAARKKLKRSTFCGPGRSFPVPDCAHVVAARRLIGRFNGSAETKAEIMVSVNRKAKSLGCKGKADAATGGVFASLSRGNEDMSTKDTDKDKGGAPAAPAKDQDLTKLSEAQLIKIIEQQSDQITQLGEQVRQLQSMADSTRAQLEARVEEVSDLRDSHRRGLAERLVHDRILVGHADTRGLEDNEDFAALAETYAERTIESLEDAVKDVFPEVRRAIGKMTSGKGSFLADTGEPEDPVGRHRQPDPEKKGGDADTVVSDKDLESL